MHLEAAEIDRARHDHLLDGVARLRIARARVFAGEKAHGFLRRSVSTGIFDLAEGEDIAFRIHNIEIARTPRSAGERLCYCRAFGFARLIQGIDADNAGINVQMLVLTPMGAIRDRLGSAFEMNLKAVALANGIK